MGFDRDRLIRSGRNPAVPGPEQAQFCTVLGKVTTASPTVGKFLNWQPVVVTGTETEGGAPTLVTNTAVTLKGVLVQGSAAQNDIVLFRWADWRWVTEGNGGSCGFVYTIGGCGGGSVRGAVMTLSQGGVDVATGTTSGRVSGTGGVTVGSGYTSPPTIAFTGGGGSGAAATANMRVANATRTSGGSGYTNGSYTNGTFTGGGGTGATFNYTVTGGVIQPTLAITNSGGNNYTSPPTPVFNAGAGTGAAATTTLGVRSVIITDGGSGYTTAPALSFSGGGGSGAAANPTLAINVRFTVPPGTYDYVITPPVAGYLVKTGTGLSLVCPGGGGDGGGSLAFVIDPLYFCPTCPCPGPMLRVWHIEDGNGMHTLTGPSGDPFFGVYQDSWSQDSTLVGTPSVGSTCADVLPDTPYRYVLRQECIGLSPPTGWKLVVRVWNPPGAPPLCPTYLYGHIVNSLYQDYVSTNVAPDCNATTLTFNVPTSQGGIPCPGGGGTIVATR